METFINTADATAKPKDIKNGKTAYVRGEKITGTQQYSFSGTTVTCPTDWYFQQTSLVIPESWLINQ